MYKRQIVHGAREAVNPTHTGTKAAAHYKLTVGAGETVVVRLRLADCDFKDKSAFASFDDTLALRQREADEFYATVIPQDLSPDAQNVMRQGFAGMLWSKQFYHYIIRDWLQGDPGNMPPPPERRKGRNHEWTHPVSYTHLDVYKRQRCELVPFPFVEGFGGQ